MASVAHEPSGAAPPEQRVVRQVVVSEMWASAAMWLMAL
jgi:hypothetical protein